MPSLLLASILASGCQPVLSDSPMTEDQLTVYRSFLDLFSSLPWHNLANRTAPFDLRGVSEDNACLRGIEFENLRMSRRTIHAFSPEITKGRELKLVDPLEQAKILQREDVSPDGQKGQSKEESDRIMSKFGFLELSEIAFDKKHQFAVLRFRFFCGSRCKTSETLVMEKVGNEWSNKTRRACAAFIN